MTAIKKLTALTLLLAATIFLLASCSAGDSSTPLRTREIIVTAEGGSTLAPRKNVEFISGRGTGTVIEVFPEQLKQTIDGIGSSFTESSAFVLAHLSPEKRREVLEKTFGSEGANFSLTRTHIGACDFSVEGHYSYDDVAGDQELAHFSIQPDKQGFEPGRYPGVKDPAFDLLPMIKEARAIKAAQADTVLGIIASAWTAPSWMKDIEEWHIPGSPENNWQGTGGQLKPQYVPTYARYLVKYLDAYAAEGISIWGMTPVNEPQGNNGQWESMHFSPESQRDFVKRHLGPALRASSHSSVKILGFDQNRDHLEEWADVLLSDDESADYFSGIAVHWYASTFKVYEEILDRVHDKYPAFRILNSEACIDDLGKKAPNGVADSEKFQESGWFGNDAFWWNDNATDWAYTANWPGVIVEDHPIYTPVHRYARDIIVGVDHWLSGWVDWNLVLDAQGGPNHVGNFCGAPIMIDTENGDVYYTPVFHVLAQLSRTIRPGDRAVGTKKELSGMDADSLHACATLNPDGLLSVQMLNTTKSAMAVMLQIGEQHAALEVPANCVQTVRIQL